MSDIQQQPEPQQLKQRRQTNLPHLLLQATHVLNDRLIRELHRRGHTDLRNAHSALLANLDIEGTRLTVLAERAGMTKQAMAELLLDLEQKGYVERRPDPTDGRAKSVYFTQIGRQALRDALDIAGEIEAEFSAVLGKDGVQLLRLALTRTLTQAHLNRQAHAR